VRWEGTNAFTVLTAAPVAELSRVAAFDEYFHMSQVVSFVERAILAQNMGEELVMVFDNHSAGLQQPVIKCGVAVPAHHGLIVLVIDD
jgi:hypothetical protein